MSDNAKKKNDDGKIYWLDQRKNINLLMIVLCVACAAVFVADAFYVKHPHFNPEYIFGFYGLYGFACFIFIVFAGKLLRKLVMRDEDYYDR